jgi:hypothetical protein
MFKFNTNFKSVIFTILGSSFLGLSCLASDLNIYKRGPECIDGFQKTLSDVNGSYYDNPISKITFCYYESAGVINTMFSDLSVWSKKKTQKMNISAINECENQGRSAYIVEFDSYPSRANYFMRNSYVCLSKSELDSALNQGYFSNGGPEMANSNL